MTPKKPWPILLVKILRFLKRTKVLGLHFIKMSSKTPVKILGYFIRTMFLTPKNPWPTFACQNLGTFKEYKDIGLTSYRNLRFSTFQNLGVFHKNHVYWHQKFHGLFCLSKSWDFLKRTEILGLHCIKMSSKTPVKFLGYFIRAMFLTPKNPCPTFACQNLGTFKEYRDIGLTSYRNLRISTCQNLGVFHKSHVFWHQKPMVNFCLSKSWAFWRVQRH